MASKKTTGDSKSDKKAARKLADKVKKQLAKAKEAAKKEAAKAKAKAKKQAAKAKEKAKKEAAKAKEAADKAAKKAKKDAKGSAKSEAEVPVESETVVAPPQKVAAAEPALDSLTVAALRTRAREAGLVGYSKLTKAQLVEKLK